MNPSYERHYETHFKDLPHQGRLLELGVFEGDSMRYWARRLAGWYIHGLDINIQDKARIQFGNVSLSQCSQDDDKALSLIAAGKDFDIVIDDASHLGYLSRRSFSILWPRLKPGGWYVIEDWGTGYWKGWPDGRKYRAPGSLWAKVTERFNLSYPQHANGMVGFVKSLIDVAGNPDRVRGSYAGTSGEELIDGMHVYPGVVFLRKANRGKG